MVLNWYCVIIDSKDSYLSVAFPFCFPSLFSIVPRRFDRVHYLPDRSVFVACHASSIRIGELSGTIVAIPCVEGGWWRVLDEIFGDARNTEAVNRHSILGWNHTFTINATPSIMMLKNAVIGNRVVHGSVNRGRVQFEVALNVALKIL